MNTYGCHAPWCQAIVQGVKARLFGVMGDIEIGRPATGEPAVARVDQTNVCVIAQPKK